MCTSTASKSVQTLEKICLRRSLASPSRRQRRYWVTKTRWTCIAKTQCLPCRKSFLARFRKKKKPEQWSRPIPHADLWFLKKNYLFFFFFAAFLAGFFAAGLGAVFGAGASSSGSSPTITSSSSSVSTISSVSPASSSSSSSRDSSLSSSKLSFSISIPSSPGGIFGPQLQRGSTRRCSGRSYLKFHPVLETLLPYSPGAVKHSALFPARDLWGEGERCEGNP